jgi:hypothetical protein
LLLVSAKVIVALAAVASAEELVIERVCVAQAVVGVPDHEALDRRLLPALYIARVI